MPLYPQTPSSLASFKSRLVLPFWYWLTQVVLEKRPLNGSSSTCSITVYVVFLWVCQNICQNGVVFHIFGAIAINIIMVRSWVVTFYWASLYMCLFVFIGDLFASFLPLIGETTIQVANGTEGRRRHAMYSRCFTPSAVKGYYDVYNQVAVSSVIKR